MKIISSLSEDIWHKLGHSSYEWWYFDAISEDGYSLVITFFYGLPFSPYYNKKIANMEKGSSLADPSQHVAIYFCLYGNNRPLAYVLNEYSQSYSFDQEQPNITIGNCHLSYNSNQGFLIKLEATALWGRKVKGELVFKPEFFPLIDWPSIDSEHVWNCVAPRCKVGGELTITGLIKTRKIDFHGLGYHDHNHGNRPMHYDMKKWHWGRLHTKKHTAIYYIIENQNDQEAFLAVLKDTGEVIYLGSTNFHYEQKKDLMGVEYFSQISLTPENNDILALKIVKTRMVDQGPFYLRFLAEQQLTTNQENTKHTGFAEAFEPGKLFVKAFWPFVKMPIRKFY